MLILLPLYWICEVACLYDIIKPRPWLEVEIFWKLLNMFGLNEWSILYSEYVVHVQSLGISVFDDNFKSPAREQLKTIMHVMIHTSVIILVGFELIYVNWSLFACRHSSWCNLFWNILSAIELSGNWWLLFLNLLGWGRIWLLFIHYLASWDSTVQISNSCLSEPFTFLAYL